MIAQAVLKRTGPALAVPGGRLVEQKTKEACARARASLFHVILIWLCFNGSATKKRHAHAHAHRSHFDFDMVALTTARQTFGYKLPVMYASVDVHVQDVARARPTPP